MKVLIYLASLVSGVRRLGWSVGFTYARIQWRAMADPECTDRAVEALRAEADSVEATDPKQAAAHRDFANHMARSSARYRQRFHS